MIEVANLVYDYPTRRALHGVSFRVEPRSVVALVGPNGAGKTTLMRCIVGLDEFHGGRVAVDGIDVARDPRSAQARIGFLPDHFGLYGNLTARRCLSYWAAAYKLPRAERAARVEEVARQLKLEDKLDARAGELSRGQRQRLALAQAILHKPKLLVADEPASGLDPEARADLAGLIRDLRDAGMTILVSSHILAELEAYSTHMLILRDGRALEYAPVAHDAGAARRLRLRLAEPRGDALDALAAAPGVSDAAPTEDGATFAFSGGPAEQAALLRRLVEAGLPVCALADEADDLQQAYLRRVRAKGAAA